MNATEEANLIGYIREQSRQLGQIVTLLERLLVVLSAEPAQSPDNEEEET